MLHHTPAVVLNTIKYGETSLILHLYTELFGYQTYMLKGVRKTNKSGGSASHMLLPGTFLDTVVQHQEQKNFQVIKDFHLRYIYKEAYQQMAKNSLIIYVIELLSKCAQEPEPHPEIFYLTEAILQLIDQTSLQDILLTPQWYSLQLLNHLGFGIEDSYSFKQPYLNLIEGRFTNTFSDDQNSCNMQISELIGQILSLDITAINQIKSTASLRKDTLTKILQYAKLHIPTIPALKSLAVVQSVMASV
jgi:DNA repair protein RecO (recombination protein O)